MKRKRVLLLLCILNCTLQLFAQQINVQGVVYDPSGETVPGAINKMVEKSVLHFFSSLNEYKISAFFWIMKASEKLCAKSFLRG